MPNSSMFRLKALLVSMWENRRVRLILVISLIVIVSVVISIIIISLNTKPKINSDAYLVDTPLSFDTTHSVEIPTDTYSGSKFPKAVSVYPISYNDQISSIDRFLLSTGKSSMKKTNIQNVYYTWVKNEDRVEYVPNSLKLTMKFSTPVSINSGLSIITKDNAVSYLQSFLKNYLGKDYEYINPNVISQGNRLRIEFNRSIDGLPLYMSGLDSYSEYIIIDISGNLYQASLNLIDLNISQRETISLVDVSNMSTVLQSDKYPKQVFQGVYPNTIPIPTAQRGDSLDNLNSLQQAKASKAKSVTLGYYFFDSSYKQLVPVYRIESEGLVEFNKKTYKVPIVVIANALDPKRVYLPK